MTIEIAAYHSPLGEVMMALRDARVCALAFTDRWPPIERRLAQRFGTAAPRRDGAVKTVARRLDAYFAGDLQALDEVAIDPGGTAFQGAVWAVLRRVPAGQTTTYAALARTIGSPRAVRAVGAANAANPIWLIIPCHRAIGSDGRLVGYAGGVERKRWLLEHEGALQPDLLGGCTVQRAPMRADQLFGRGPD
jgi:methylated-DNA-[protein]-cysteine S-methyltransferase